VTVDLRDVSVFWNGEINNLQYDLYANANAKEGTITFSLKDKE
jgi:hypothetical protein